VPRLLFEDWNVLESYVQVGTFKASPTELSDHLIGSNYSEKFRQRAEEMVGAVHGEHRRNGVSTSGSVSQGLKVSRSKRNETSYLCWNYL